MEIKLIYKKWLGVLVSELILRTLKKPITNS